MCWLVQVSAPGGEALDGYAMRVPLCTERTPLGRMCAFRFPITEIIGGGKGALLVTAHGHSLWYLASFC